MKMNLLHKSILLLIASVFTLSCRQMDAKSYAILNLYQDKLSMEVSNHQDILENENQYLKTIDYEYGNRASDKQLIKFSERIIIKLNDLNGILDKIIHKLENEKKGILLSNIFDEYPELNEQEQKNLNTFLNQCYKELNLQIPQKIELNERQFRCKYNLLVICLLREKQISFLKISSSILRQTMVKMTQSEYKDGEVKALAEAKSNVITLGKPFELKLFLAKVLKDSSLKIYVDNQAIPIEHGIGKVCLKADKLGTATLNGFATFKNGDRDTTIAFHKDYKVFER